MIKIGAIVKVIAVHREEDKKYLGKYGKIIDGAGFHTDWLVEFSSRDFTGFLQSELEFIYDD